MMIIIMTELICKGPIISSTTSHFHRQQFVIQCLLNILRIFYPIIIDGQFQVFKGHVKYKNNL